MIGVDQVVEHNVPVAPPAVAAPVRRPKRRQIIVLSVFLAAVVAFFAVAWVSTRGNPENAKVGDCVRLDGADSVKVVACTDPSATFKVVGRVEDKTQVDAGLDACDPFVDQGVEQAFWSGEEGKTGFVLCLAANG